MKEEKELSPREGGNLLSCPQNEMGGERREGRKRKRNGQAEIETDPDIREVCTLIMLNKITITHYCTISFFFQKNLFIVLI